VFALAWPSRKNRLFLIAGIIAACSDGPLSPVFTDESPHPLDITTAVDTPADVSQLAGTYRFTLCHPSCAIGSRVGHGTLVIVRDSLVLPFPSHMVEQIRQWSAFIVWRGHRPPNACFRVSARRSIGDREYYPGIIPEALTAVTRSDSGVFEIPLYGSPDAAFLAKVVFDRAGSFTGVGIQYDWNGRGPPQLGTIEGHRVAEPKPSDCFPDI